MSLYLGKEGQGPLLGVDPVGGGGGGGPSLTLCKMNGIQLQNVQY